MTCRTTLLLSSAAIVVALCTALADAMPPSSEASMSSAASMRPSDAGSVPKSRLVATFSDFAGSTANAQSLVEGLRAGTTITLIDANNATTTFTPATHAMGWGNVKIALALAQAELVKAGVTNPTPADIEAALNGGTITVGSASTTFAGVLRQRADGLGWGQIARADGLNLGKVVSAVSKPAGAGQGQVATSSRMHSGKGITTAGGNTSSRDHGDGKASAGIVTAGGETIGPPSGAKGHASGSGMIAGNSHAASGTVTTAASSGTGGRGHHTHGKASNGG